MLNEIESLRPVAEKIKEARDLLSRLYREIGISAVAAALEIGKDIERPARPRAAVLTQGAATEHETAA